MDGLDGRAKFVGRGVHAHAAAPLRVGQGSRLVVPCAAEFDNQHMPGPTPTSGPSSLSFPGGRGHCPRTDSDRTVNTLT